MAIGSFTGLASGIDTASIVNQLMLIEGQGQTRLKTKMANETNVLKALQDVSSKVSALQTTAKDLTKAGAFSPVTTTTSNPAVTATASAGTPPSSVEFTVNTLAAAHRLSFNQTALPGATVVANGETKVTLTKSDGTEVSIDTGNGSMEGLAAGINNSGAGVTATVVNLNDGTQRLSVTANSTGEAGAFTLKNLDGSDLLGGATVRAGVDAEITIGSDTVKSATNTFDKAIAGLVINIGAEAKDKTVTVTVATNGIAAKDAAKKLVDDLNSLFSQLDGLSKYDPATKKSGSLNGDSAILTLRNSALTAVYPTDGTSLAKFGIETDRYGKLTFNETKFNEAYRTSPDQVVAALGAGTTSNPGFAARIAKVAEQAVDRASGTLTGRITSENSMIKRLGDDIASWDTRLELRRTALTRQFTAMEVALSKAQGQGNWLSSQLKSSDSGQ